VDEKLNKLQFATVTAICRVQVTEAWTTPCYINTNNEMPANSLHTGPLHMIRLHSTDPLMVKYTTNPA